MAKVIFVDGVSSSGRTSLVKRFCGLSANEYHAVHIDEFTEHLPDGVWERCRGSDQGWAEIGVAFNGYLEALRPNYANLIADAFYKLPRARDHLFGAIGRKNIYYVQLYCGLEELERRELLR